MPASSRQGLSYPANLASIPYASYLKINKLTYDEGMAKVAKNQDDALGAIQGSQLAQGITKGIAGFFSGIYSDGTDDQLNSNRGGSARGEGRAAFPNSDGNVIPKGKKKRDQVMARQRGYNQSYCNLPLPNEMQYEYGANWNNTFKLGTLALIAEDPGRAAQVAGAGIVIGGGLGVALNAFQGAGPKAQMAQAGGQGAMQGLKTGANMFGVNSPINPTNLVGLAGLAPNENAIQMFKNVDFRSFDFSFEFAARNEDESRTIETIIEWFKRGMHPNTRGYSGATPLLGFPDVWTIEPKFVDTGYKNGGVKSVRHKMLPKTKLCALTNLRVNTTPMAQVQTVYDGSFPLVTVSVRFTELTALTKADFVNDDFSLSY